MERMRTHLRQGIKLTGLHSEEFRRNIDNLEFVQVMFSGTLPPNMLRDWQPTYEGNHLVINMHNRLFIKRSLAPNRLKADFGHGVDPDGILDLMQRDEKFIHAADNTVEYYQGPAGAGYVQDAFFTGLILTVSLASR